MKASTHTTMEPHQGLGLPLMGVNTDPGVWAVGGKTGRAENSRPVEITLKNPNVFPCQKQDPLRAETRQGLTPIVRHLTERGLLIQCHSPCHTPALGVRKPNGDWCPVPDLRLKTRQWPHDIQWCPSPTHASRKFQKQQPGFLY